jgi:23S rRNA G2069 N7-methylase RlmK/C1962 C5-methylase RlmI
MFQDLSSMRLSQLNSNTEKIMPYGFQECSQMNTSRRVKTVTDWLNGLVVDFYDDRIVKFVQHLDKYLSRNIDYTVKKILHLAVTLKSFG